MSGRNLSDGEMLKGALDMMILRTLLGGDAHGHAIAKVIEHTSEDILEVEQGSLYPALHQLSLFVPSAFGNPGLTKDSK